MVIGTTSKLYDFSLENDMMFVAINRKLAGSGGINNDSYAYYWLGACTYPIHHCTGNV